MSEVASGLGRNGPWLQNAWLRVETRLDDGSMSPFVTAMGFRPTERALAFVRTVEGQAIGFGRCEYDVRPVEDRLGAGRRIELRSRDRRGYSMRREITLYDGHPFAVTRVGVSNDGRQPIRVASLHAFTTAEKRGRLSVDTHPDTLRVYRHGWQSWSPTMSLHGTALDLRSPVPILSPERPSDTPGQFQSDDVGVLHDPVGGRSVLCGAISARDFISQVYVDAPARNLDARCLADGVILTPGDSIWSELFIVDACGAPQQQLERYGDALGREMGARVPLSTPSGWCSWYYYYTQVTEDDVIRNLRFLEQHRRELPIETVQIDDGYQADIGDWLTVNEKFPHGMRWLASQIREAGFTPGIWLAPFLLAESSKTFADHPDWVVRHEAGMPLVAQRNWDRNCYGLDGSHPAARAWLEDLLGEITNGWGYDYLKIDFLFGGAIAGRRHDVNETRVQAYRQALAAVREGVGERRFVLGCGAPMAPSVGFFDGNRIGPDTAPFWRFLTREERVSGAVRPRGPDDGLSGETSTRNVLNRWWMHRRLWANDPDCLMVRGTRTKLNDDEVLTLASAIGLSGGMTLISDDLEQLSPERLRMISMMLPPLPHSALPDDLTGSDMPERFEYMDDREFDPLHIVGLFNFDDQPQDLRCVLERGEWHVFSLWEGTYRGTASASLEFEGVPPHGCRVVALRRVRSHPQLVGSDAHIGCGVLDITHQRWDEGTRTLTLGAAAAGARERRLWVTSCGRAVTSARYAGEEIRAAEIADCNVYTLNVERESELQITFS